MAWNDERQPNLTTPRLRLRPLTSADAPRIQELVSERAIADTTAVIPHPYPADGAIGWIAMHADGWADGTDVRFGIALAESDAPVGVLGIRINPPFNSAEFGYWVGTPYWGRGYMTEALVAGIDFGFETLGLNRIHAAHMTRNPASGRVMEKAGMTFEGIAREAIRRWDVYEDVAIRSILRSEWQARRAG